VSVCVRVVLNVIRCTCVWGGVLLCVACVECVCCVG